MSQLFTTPGNNLATIARETGYPVVEVPGWTTRHHGPFAAHVGATVCHHTAGADPHETASNFPSLRAVRDGVPGLAGPLSNYGLGFDGTIYVIASGTCWHAGTGGWAGMTRNSECIGIEAEDAGDGDWTPEQRDCYPRLCAVICQFLGVGAHTVCGHKEWAEPPGRKIDPAGIDMAQFREQVQQYLNNPETIPRHAHSTPETPSEDIDMDPQWLPQTQGEWNKVAYSVECGATDPDGTSAMIDQLWLTIASAYGNTDIVVVFEGYGGYRWPSWIKEGFSAGKWNDDDTPDPGTIPSGQSFRCELTPQMEVVSVYYRNNGGAVAGVLFPKTIKTT